MIGFSPAVLEAYDEAALAEKVAAVAAAPRTEEEKREHREYMAEWRRRKRGPTAPRVPKAPELPKAPRGAAALMAGKARRRPGNPWESRGIPGRQAPLAAATKLKARRRPAKVEQPKKEKPPFPWQTSAVEFAAARGGNAIFAHGTGTGKTRSASMLIKRRMEEGAHYVVVAPAGVRKGFAGSIEEWIPGQKGHVIASSKDRIPRPGSGVVPVISYELFKRIGPKLRQAGYTDLVFDEAHKAKNPDTGNYQVLSEHRPLFNGVVAMTASLTSTEPSNLVQLVDIVTGGQHDLGSPTDFRNRYVLTRGEQGGYFARKRMTRGARNEAVGFKNEKELGRKLRQYIHHVHESEIDKSVFPRKDVEDVEVPMSEDQQKLYLAALRRLPPKVLKRMKSEELSNAEMSRLYNRLIQSRGVAGGVHTMAKGVSLEASAKLTPKTQMALDHMEEHLRDTPDGKVILISNFIHGGLDVVEAGLKARGIEYGVFRGKGKGGTTEKERQAALKAFQDGKLKVMLVSPAGFEGLNAPNATMVQVYDGHFNPEMIRQGEARGIRAGGQKHRPEHARKVIVKRYISVFPERGGLIGKIQKLIGYRSRERHIDQKVWDRAADRHRVNQRILDLIAGKTRRREHQL